MHLIHLCPIQAAGGLFAAVANILTLVAGSTQLYSAFAFFTAATLVSILTLVCYLLLYHVVSLSPPDVPPTSSSPYPRDP